MTRIGSVGGGGGSSITSHTDLTNIGTNTHEQIDTHIASILNPHSVTYTQVGADPAGTDNSTDVTLAGTGTYLSLLGQQITVDPITESDISDLTHTTDHGVLTGLSDDDHTQYIKHALATAANDFLVASGSGAYVKKTLAETGAILEGDISHANIQNTHNLTTDIDHDALTNFVAAEHYDWTNETHSIITTATVRAQSFWILDSANDNYLALNCNEDLTSNRTLNFNVGNSGRTLTFSGDPTLDDWFDQSVKTTASPSFAGLTSSSGELRISGTVNFYPGGTLTITAGGEITPTASNHNLSPNSGTTDNLDTITATTSGVQLVLRGSTGNTITIRDNSSGGNIYLSGNVDKTLTGLVDIIYLQAQGANWIEVSYSDN